MRQSLYKYNANTCQYERIRINSSDVIYYIVGIVVVAILMLAIMFTVHDYTIDSEKEIVLRTQNAALGKNHLVLSGQLDSIELTLANLQREDEKLHIKFFGNPREKAKTSVENTVNSHLLLVDPEIFRDAIEALNKRSSALIKQSVKTSSFFGDQFSLDKQQNSVTRALHMLQPIQPWNTDNLLSGFGIRVNPFHKGLYEHSGIDIAMPRGSNVVATASGIVVELKTSSVQAGYGNYIGIDHGNGFITRYAHLEEILVTSRKRVEKGDVIATVGNSGGSIAPHLHYEIIRDGKAVNPIHFMIEGLSSNEYHRLNLSSQKQNQSLD